MLLTDPVDEVWVQFASEYKGKKLQSASKGVVDLGTEEERKQAEDTRKKKEEEWKSLLEFIQKKLDKDVKTVRVSSRLSSSAACLVSEEGDMSPHLEALLKASGKEVPEIKRILELNPDHPLLNKMQELYSKNPDNPVVADYAELLFGQALLAEGGQLQDPASFNQKVADLMVKTL
jgi:molecular chaperone HtpG